MDHDKIFCYCCVEGVCERKSKEVLCMGGFIYLECFGGDFFLENLSSSMIGSTVIFSSIDGCPAGTIRLRIWSTNSGSFVSR